MDVGAEIVMLESPPEVGLAHQLLLIASDPRLRESVYRKLGEYCHQCRNRLNSLKLSLFLAKRQVGEGLRRDWEEIERHYLTLERIVDRLQTICRPMTLSKVTIPLDLLFEDHRDTWSQTLASAGIELECHPPKVRGLASFDVERMAQALDTLVSWRATLQGPERSARLNWGVDSGWARIAWQEASPPNVEMNDEGRTWTLPLILRVANAHDGHCQWTEEAGWRLEISWPVSIEPT